MISSTHMMASGSSHLFFKRPLEDNEFDMHALYFITFNVLFL
jgi:hypothetical protein